MRTMFIAFRSKICSSRQMMSDGHCSCERSDTYDRMLRVRPVEGGGVVRGAVTSNSSGIFSGNIYFTNELLISLIQISDRIFS